MHAADRCAADQIPDGLLVRVHRAQFRRYAQKPYYTVESVILELRRFAGHVISSRLYCSPKALWKLNWFLRDFGYDVDLLDRDEVDESQLVGLQGVVKISHIVFNGTSLLRLAYTQISQSLACPRRYRHRYLDCWKQKDTRAAMPFGRAFEQALDAYFRREDQTSKNRRDFRCVLCFATAEIAAAPHDKAPGL